MAAARGGAVVPATVPVNIPEQAGPLGKAGPEDVVATWTGPMEIRPVADEDIAKIGIPAPRDLFLEAGGTANKPLRVTDAKFEILAGRLKYDGKDKPLALFMDEYKKVILRDLSGESAVESGDASIDMDKNLAKLAGPIKLLSTNARGKKTEVDARLKMNVELAMVLDPKDKTKTIRVVRHAVLEGATVRSDQMDLVSNVLDVLVANVVNKEGKADSLLEHMLATGDVETASRGSEPGGMKAQRLELITEKNAEGIPVPVRLLADDQVTAWRYVEKSKGIGSLSELGGAAPAPDREKAQVAAAAAQEAPKLEEMEKDTIDAGKLVADLRPRKKDVAAEAGGSASRPASQPSTQPANAGGGVCGSNRL